MTTSPQEKAKIICRQGIALAQVGDKDRAREWLRQAVKLDPSNEVAWLYLAGLAENRQEAAYALDKVEQLNPANPYLAKARAWAQQTWPELASNREDTEPVKPIAQVPALNRKESPLLTWQLAGTVAVVLLIMLGSAFRTVNTVQDATRNAVSNWVNHIFPTPTNSLDQELSHLRQALAEAESVGDRLTMIENLQKMYTLVPYDQDIAARLAELYYEQGILLRDDGNFEEAQIAFNHALTIKETMASARLEQHQVDLYLTGVTHHQQGNWTGAIAVFEQIYSQTPEYPFLDEILYSAYFNQGMALQARGDLEEALAAFRRAARVLPEVSEARQKVAEITSRLNQSSPEPLSVLTKTGPYSGDKLVVVDISEQHTYLYQGNVLVNDFVVSTGAPGRDTALGEFEIQNKIPVAYASTWNLDMPFWLGIYWSGPLQNGFHALPTVRHTGVTMWDGYLGQRVSYGCVVLSLEDAETLYDWVDVGTPVKIQW